MMQGIRKKFNITLIIWFLLLIPIIPAARGNIKPQAYSEIGVIEGQKYAWTLDSVNSEIIETLYGSFHGEIRDGKQKIYEIERITENVLGYSTDNWSLEVEAWDHQYEPDDVDGYDSIITIKVNPSSYKNALLNLASNPSVSISSYLCFIPKDTATYLAEAATLDTSINVTGNGLTITCNNTNNKVDLTYSTEGILNTVDVYYNESIAFRYVYAAGAVSLGLIFIPISLFSVIGIIYIIKRRIKVI